MQQHVRVRTTCVRGKQAIEVRGDLPGRGRSLHTYLRPFLLLGLLLPLLCGLWMQAKAPKAFRIVLGLVEQRKKNSARLTSQAIELQLI